MIVKTYRSNEDCQALKEAGHEFFDTPKKRSQKCGKEGKGMMGHTEGAIEMLLDATESRIEKM